MEKQVHLTVIDSDIRVIRNISKAMKKEGWINPIYGFENEVYTLEMSRSIILVSEEIKRLSADMVEKLFCDTGDN